MERLRDLGVRLPFVCVKTFEGTRQEYEEIINRVWENVFAVEQGSFSKRYPVDQVDDFYKFVESNEERLCFLDTRGKDWDAYCFVALNTALIYFEYSMSKKTLVPVVNLHAIRETGIFEDCISFEKLFFKHFAHVDKNGVIKGIAATREFNTFVELNTFNKMPGIIVSIIN